MRLAESVATLVNDQVNHELNASYTYLGMAAYFDSEGLAGFASWFRAHSEEETGHAMRLYEFLVASGHKVSFAVLDAPSVSYQSPEDALASALKHEEMVTGQIKNIFRAAMKAEEFTAQPMLHWFLAEQVQEEDLFTTTLERVQAVSNRFDLLTLDKELGARQPANTAADASAE